MTRGARTAEMRGLSAKLEAALVRELADTYRHVAGAIFKGALRPPAIELVDARSRLGRFVADTRTIEISRPLVLESPWGVVVEVLKHEMAHQYVWEVLGEEDEAPHGPRFRAVCARLGIDGAPTGRPAPTAPHDPERERVAEKIARLLALAESPNAHEAEAAMAAAQRLLLTHNIELVRTRAARGYGWRHLGTPSGRTQEHERNFVDLPVHLHQIALGQLVARIGDAVLQGSVAREQHQPLAIRVQASGGIDARHRNVVLQGPAAGLVGELAQHAEGLVEEQQARIRQPSSPDVGIFYT